MRLLSGALFLSFGLAFGGCAYIQAAPPEEASGTALGLSVALLDHPLLDVERMQPTDEVALALMRESLANLPAETQDGAPLLVVVWRQTLADPYFPAKVEAVRQVAALQFADLPRTCNGHVLDARRAAEVAVARWLAWEKFGLELPEEPLGSIEPDRIR